MSRHKPHRPELPDLLKRYAASRTLDLIIRKHGNGMDFSIIDKDYSRIDIWLTGTYHIVYNKTWRINRQGTVRARSGERGMLPIQKIEIGRFLDKMFFSADVIEERELVKNES